MRSEDRQADDTSADFPEGLGQPLSAEKTDGRPAFLAAAGGAALAILVFLLNGPLLLMSLGIVVFVLGLVSGIGSLFPPGIEIYSGGIKARRFGRSEYCRWNEVKELSLTVTRQFASGLQCGSSVGAELVRRDGRRFAFDGITSDFAEAMQREVYSVLVPEMRAAFESGAVVDFGVLALSSDGLWHAKRPTSWCDLAGVSVEFGDTVLVKRRGQKSIRVKAERVTNLPIFMLLVKEHLVLPEGVG